MKRIFSSIILFVLTVSTIAVCRSASFAQTKKKKVSSATQKLSVNEHKYLLPAPKGLVNDFADILDQKTKDELEQTLTNFKAEAKIDFVIAMVKTTGNKSAFDYSLAVAKDWGVGAKNPDKAGVFLLVAVEDRKWHIQITRILEKDLSVDEVGELSTLMRSFFKEQKYGEGIAKCVEEFIKVLKEKRRVK